jgi:hypothetical protein
MIYIGRTPDEKSITLPQPVSVRLNRAEDAPADGFTGTFPLIGSFGAITGLRIYGADGTLCFDGMIDEQKESCGGTRLLTLTARSRAALLLDNEAVPRTYSMPSLQAVFLRHIKPYGFSGWKGNTKMFAGELQVTKGMSEWQAAQTFCRRFLKTEPFLTIDGVFDASGERPSGSLLFDQHSGVKYSSLTIHRKYCCLYSEFYTQSGKSGSYTLAAQDKEAQAMGVKRSRFLAAGTGAGDLIRSARRKAYFVTVLCPGEVPAKLRMAAVVQDKTLGSVDGLYIAEINYTLGEDGEFTRFTLRRTEGCG